jgi:heterodisulfide reductase subunit A
MDTRAYSKGYEEYYRRAEKKYGVQYTRCRISDLREDPDTHDLILRYFDEQGHLQHERFDLVTLSIGMEISPKVRELGQRLGIELDDYGFCHTVQFNPLETSRAGIYAVGPFREPKDIPESIVEASGAAAAVAARLSESRFTLTTRQEYPPERDVAQEEPRVGVFVCHCGSNIGGFLDVPDVSEYAKTLPHVVHAENNLYTCSQDSIKHIIERVKELNLNRVVVASCTPLTHEPLFQDALRQAGLNPYLFEMANIRNQCSWVHPGDWDGATAKAKTLVRMAAARAAELEPLRSSKVPIQHAALIIGGGAAGMNAALSLAEQGFPVHLAEKSNQLGGNLRNLHYLIDTECSPQDYLAELIDRVTQHPLISVYLQTELIQTGGFKGNFTSMVRDARGMMQEVQHGVTIVAIGGMEYKGHEYGYGKHPDIMTQLEFEALLDDMTSSLRGASLRDEAIPNASKEIASHPSTSSSLRSESAQDARNDVASVVMIQCVGPGEKFCARLCCSTALKNALKIKELNPQAEVTILYRDIRTYGFKERLYTEARRAGVRFIRFDFDHKPTVEILEEKSETPALHPQRGASAQNPKSKIIVRVHDPILNRDLELQPELLVLSTPIVPQKDAHELSARLKVPLDVDGFFLEAHPKLRPVDFASDGLFMAGVAHYPKFLDETIAQAQAAAARAAIILSQESVLTNARVAVVDNTKCVGCLTCVRICPFGVPKIKANLTGVGNIVGAAYIEAAVCQGCGSCVAECPAQAIQLMHYRDAEMLPKIDALFSRVVEQSHSHVVESVAQDYVPIRLFDSPTK